MSDLDKLRELLPLLIPVVLIQLGLLVAALVDWWRRPRTRGSRWLWLALILFVQMLGPIAYFVFGREDE